MSEPHRMTLRPPWEAEPLPDGRTRHRRRFGRPRLSAGETVWLVGIVADVAEVWLNGVTLGAGIGEFALDVTADLLPRNELCIDTAGDLGPVAVEVRAGGGS